MSRIVVDPVTRIEGHLRIEAQLDGTEVADAWSSSTMFRGIEIILKGRDPRDAWVFTQRICGVCNERTGARCRQHAYRLHYLAQVSTFEHLHGDVPPPVVLVDLINANNVRVFYLCCCTSLS